MRPHRGRALERRPRPSLPADAVHQPDRFRVVLAIFGGVDLIGSTPEQFHAHKRAEIQRFERAVTAAGIKPE